jgi:hypothetical protein
MNQNWREKVKRGCGKTKTTGEKGAWQNEDNNTNLIFFEKPFQSQDSKLVFIEVGDFARLVNTCHSPTHVERLNQRKKKHVCREKGSPSYFVSIVKRGFADSSKYVPME